MQDFTFYLTYFIFASKDQHLKAAVNNVFSLHNVSLHNNLNIMIFAVANSVFGWLSILLLREPTGVNSTDSQIWRLDSDTWAVFQLPWLTNAFTFSLSTINSRGAQQLLAASLHFEY